MKGFGLAALIALAIPTLAYGDEKIPDVQGKWIGKSHSVVVGHGAHWPNSDGSYNKPGLFSKDLVIEITGQSDRRVWGITTLSGNGEQTREPFIGELFGPKYRELLVADTDGYLRGTFTGNQLSFCYAQAGKEMAVVSCSELKKSR
ncbi:MAG TPA: hypothetical protein VL614_15475 [Acetobacteraceae bacterium]|jgi:hypothetical protein|nr:hypothetical protein [Acetobacteraceae bacterium]